MPFLSLSCYLLRLLLCSALLYTQWKLHDLTSDIQNNELTNQNSISSVGHLKKITRRHSPKPRELISKHKRMFHKWVTIVPKVYAALQNNEQCAFLWDSSRNGIDVQFIHAKPHFSTAFVLFCFCLFSSL